jgi:hypothetical protein
MHLHAGTTSSLIFEGFNGSIDIFVFFPAFARLQGITKSISQYPTAKRRFDVLVKALLSELERTMGGSQSASGSQAQRLRNSSPDA